MSISFLSLLKAEVKTSYFLLIPLMTKYPFSARATDLYIEQLLNAAAPGRHRISMVKDVRIFVNTIDHAIRLMTDNGVPATAHREERDGYIEYTVRIPTAAAQR